MLQEDFFSDTSFSVGQNEAFFTSELLTGRLTVAAGIMPSQGTRHRPTPQQLQKETSLSPGGLLDSLPFAQWLYIASPVAVWSEDRQSMLGVCLGHDHKMLLGMAVTWNLLSDTTFDTVLRNLYLVLLTGVKWGTVIWDRHQITVMGALNSSHSSFIELNVN